MVLGENYKMFYLTLKFNVNSTDLFPLTLVKFYTMIFVWMIFNDMSWVGGMDELKSEWLASWAVGRRVTDDR